jgi:hypothetical protein
MSGLAEVASPRRITLVVVGVTLAIGAVQPVHATDTQACGTLPESTLQIYDIKAPALDEQIVEMPTLKRVPGSNFVSSFHGSVLTTHDVVVFFEISHRIITQ